MLLDNKRKNHFLSVALINRSNHKSSLDKYDCDSLEQLTDRLLFKNNNSTAAKSNLSKKLDESNEYAGAVEFQSLTEENHEFREETVEELDPKEDLEDYENDFEWATENFIEDSMNLISANNLISSILNGNANGIGVIEQEEEEEISMSYAGNFDVFDTIVKSCINYFNDINTTNSRFSDKNELVSYSNNCTKG